MKNITLPNINSTGSGRKRQVKSGAREKNKFRDSKQRLRRLVGKLSGHTGGVPVLPGFDEAAVLDTDDGGAGDVGDFAGGVVFTFGEPVDASEVALGEGKNRGDFEIGENCAQTVVKFFEFGGAANDFVAIVNDPIGSEELRDGVAVAFVPDFVEPADDELFVLIERGYGVGGGHEKVPP